jgi:hypothetical protein
MAMHPTDELLPHDIAHAELIASCVINLLREVQPIVPEWLDQNQAAIFLGTTAKTLEVRRQTKTGPRYSKHGARLVRYHVSDLTEWMRSGYVS